METNTKFQIHQKAMGNKEIPQPIQNRWDRKEKKKKNSWIEDNVELHGNSQEHI